MMGDTGHFTTLLDLGKVKLGCCLPDTSGDEVFPLWPLEDSSNSSPIGV